MGPAVIVTRRSSAVAAWLAVLLSPGCVTAWQDGRTDACRSFALEDPAASAGFDHDQANSGSGCVYEDRTLDFGLDDPDAYERGLIAGTRACWQEVYDEAWFAAEAARPCATVYGDPLPEEKP